MKEGTLWCKVMPIANMLMTYIAGLEELLSKLNELPEVIEANRLYFGTYDIIMKVEADTIEWLNKAIGSDIKRIGWHYIYGDINQK
jgi:DNA-binding Lrp family transcriptional regulator